MREYWREDKESEYGMLAFIAGKLSKSGGGKPSPQALGHFFAKVDADTSWFPGKLEGQQRGRKRNLSKTQEAADGEGVRKKKKARRRKKRTKKSNTMCDSMTNRSSASEQT